MLGWPLLWSLRQAMGETVTSPAVDFTAKFSTLKNFASGRE
jgi:hypothetical protein